MKMIESSGINSKELRKKTRIKTRFWTNIWTQKLRKYSTFKTSWKSFKNNLFRSKTI
jgi:hypothetical protein